ncbi:MAG: hypothetical protein GC149_19730 [Gammaproteobacteria bacterium]|nr:hypothetical protein [Gammaproteobacteria bacterium]
MTDSTMKKLDEAIRQEVSQHRLDERELAQLMAFQQQVTTQIPQPSLTKKRRLLAGLVLACVSLVIGFVIMQHNGLPDYTQQIAEEVVKNHLKLKPLDMTATDMSSIQSYFTQLDFMPSNSKMLQDDQRLLGGRYCSIKGVTAAQLRYQSQVRGVNTFYQVAYHPEKFGEIPDIDKNETPREVMVKGLRVRLWVEKGLLMVLVTQPE